MYLIIIYVIDFNSAKNSLETLLHFNTLIAGVYKITDSELSKIIIIAKSIQCEQGCVSPCVCMCTYMHLYIGVHELLCGCVSWM